METRYLRQFIHLADSLHFGRASEASHVSPSALSRGIQRLEENLGATLFERNNRSVSLTHAGKLFLVYARQALADWEAVRNRVMEQSAELRGEISVYCSVTASHSFLFEILSDFRDRHPRIEVKLHTGDPEDAITRVMSGEEDIAIGARPETLNAALAFRRIAVSPLVFIGARQLETWQDQPMILPERGLARRRTDAWLQARKKEAIIYAQVAGNEAIVSMVSLGFGIGVVPRIVLDNHPLADTVRVLDVAPALEDYEVGLFTLKKKLSSPIIAAFWGE